MKKIPSLINHAAVSCPEDLCLFKYSKGSFSSSYYKKGASGSIFHLDAEADDFYREITFLCTVKAGDINAILQQNTVLAESKNTDTGNGWQFYLDQHGYLCLRGLGQYSWLNTRSQLSLTCFVRETFRVGWTFCAHPAPGSPFQLRLLAASGIESPMSVVFGIGVPFLYGYRPPETDKEKMFSTPVAQRLEIPLLAEKTAHLKILSLAAWNSSRYNIFCKDGGKHAAGCTVEQDFSGASRVFSFYGKGADTLELFTGPEFAVSTSCWIFAKVTGANPWETRVRLHFREDGHPNMSPVIFASTDRRNWFRVRNLEPAEMGRKFDPLVLAPDREFFLASSIPFMIDELNRVKKKAVTNHFVELVDAGSSVEKRKIELFRITDPDTDDTRKKHLAIIAGQHSPQEMLGAHFLSPMLDYLLKNPKLLEEMVLHFVPIVNMDCAFWGSNGSNLNGANLNRFWAKNAQPENRGIRNYFLNLRRKGVKVDMFLDCHAGGIFRNHILFRHSERGWSEVAGENAPQMIKQQEKLLELMEHYAGIRKEDSWVGSLMKRKRRMASGYFQHAFPESLSYTLELSTSTYFDPHERGNRVLDQKSLDIVGIGILKSFLHYVGIKRQ